MEKEKKSRLFRTFFVYLALSFFIFFLDRKGWLSFFHRSVDPLMGTAEEKVYSLKFVFSQPFGFLETSREKDRQILRLQGELRQLAVNQNELAVCLEENDHLKRLLGAPLPPEWKFIQAKVVGVADKMRLDRGRRDGVEEGMMVITENVLVGRVVLAGERHSLVRLINDPETKIPVLVKQPLAGQKPQSGVQARGLLLGRLGEKVILDRVLQSEDIQKGDLVVTSGEEGWLADLLVGQIQEVFPPSAEVYQKAVVSPLVDYRQQSIVFLVFTR